MKKVYISIQSSWNKEMLRQCSETKTPSVSEFESYVYKRYGCIPNLELKLKCYTLIMTDKAALFFRLQWNTSVRKVEPFINEEEKPLIYRAGH